MRAYGSDRLKLREDGVALLSCRTPKNGWQARIEKTLTSPLHPGTAVLWDDEYWEVIGVDILPVGVRYTLEKWPENSAAAMPLVDRYDEERENERAADRLDIQKRESGRIAANWLAIFTGHLPRAVQNRLADAVNVRPLRLTMISVALEFAIGVVGIWAFVGKVTGTAGLSAMPRWLIPVGILCLGDGLIRFYLSFSQGQAVGSVVGLLGYALFYAVSPNKSKLIGPFEAERGYSATSTRLSVDEKKASDVTALEPLLTLLDETDQRRLADRYGIDYRHSAKSTAATIMVFSLLGGVTAIPSIRQLHLSGLVSLVVAAYFFIEQLLRLSQFEKGPSSSVLRFVVRPFVSGYLK